MNPSQLTKYEATTKDMKFAAAGVSHELQKWEESPTKEQEICKLCLCWEDLRLQSVRFEFKQNLSGNNAAQVQRYKVLRGMINFFSNCSCCLHGELAKASYRGKLIMLVLANLRPREKETSKLHE